MKPCGPPAAHPYTAAHYAAALGWTRQAFQQRVAHLDHGWTLINGNQAKTWNFYNLPAEIQSELVTMARQRHYRDIDALLSSPPPLWQPAVPLAQVPTEALNAAVKLQEVLTPFLFIKESDTRSQADREAAGLAAYQRIFGKTISDRWFRDLLKRTIDRDQGRADWHRLEIYLPDNIGPERKPRAVPAGNYDHSTLIHRLNFKNPAQPTLSERQNALDYGFNHFLSLIAQHPNQSAKIKQSILAVLHSTAPCLAKSYKALKRNWNRKYQQWLANGKTPSAIADQRPVASGNFCVDDLEPDLNLIVDEAFHHDGRLSLAIRKLRRANRLSPIFTNRFTLDVRRHKSYVAQSIRKEITSRLEGLLAYRRSPWQVQMQGCKITRGHSSYLCGDYVASDDCSFNIVMHHIDEHGRPALTRGEVLLFFDCRSLYPLGYVMVAGHYNGETVRRGILHIHDRFGLPHKSFVFERGIWESRLLIGNRARDFLSWDEYEMGLRSRGLRIELRNVTTPGAKLIEVLFNNIQQDQRNEKGFVGFNEREYGQERLQKKISQVRRGLLDPSEEFHSEDEWRQVLDQSLERYMHEPQNGLVLRGSSPAEMFADHRPLRKLPDDARFLLSTHRVKAKVKQNGLTITIRGQHRSFYNEDLGQFLGRNVYAWFNIEQPDLLTVSDLDMKKFLSVKRHVLPAFDATDEQLKAVNQDRSAFMRTARIRFDQIKHPVRNFIVREDVIDEDAKVLGEHIRQQTEEHAAEQTAETRQLAKLVRSAESAGVTLAGPVHHAARRRRGIELFQETSAQIAREERTGPDAAKIESPVHPYVLDTQSAVKPTVPQYWALRARISKILPQINLHAITRKALNSTDTVNPSPDKMTEAQLAKMIEVFSAILRDATTPKS